MVSSLSARDGPTPDFGTFRSQVLSAFAHFNIRTSAAGESAFVQPEYTVMHKRESSCPFYPNSKGIYFPFHEKIW
jgi:hypothetical protein